MIIARKCSKLIYIYVYRQCCLVHFAANCSNWKMTFRKPVATTWKMNENQFRQLFLSPWHMVSYIWVHFGLWRPIFTVKIWFSHIFPALAWSPFLSVNLTDKLARLILSGNNILILSGNKMSCYCSALASNMPVGFPSLSLCFFHQSVILSGDKTKLVVIVVHAVATNPQDIFSLLCIFSNLFSNGLQ